MDGKGFDDSGEWHPYASEPVETEDSQSPSPALADAFQPDEDGRPALPATPLEPTETARHEAVVENNGYDPEDHPSEPYVGIARVSGSDVSGLQPVATEEDPTPPPNGYSGHSGNGYGSATHSGNGYDSTAPSEAGYDSGPYEGTGYDGNGGSTYVGGADGGNGYGGAESVADGGSTYVGRIYGEAERDGNGSSTYTGGVSGGNGNATGEHSGDDLPVAHTYRGRARVEAQAQPYVSEIDLSAHLAGGQMYPAYGASDLYGSVAVVDPPARVTSTRPGYTLTEDLAEQRRQDARRIEKADGEEQRAQMPLWQELPLLLVVAFCVAVLIRSFLLQAFYIPSSSMEQTLLVGDRVLVNKILYDLRSPERGEVVVFRGTDRWAPENFGEEPGGMLDRIGDTLGDLVGVSSPGEKDFIKRVIGLPGDRVACCDDQGRVTVNGVGIDEPYINANSSLDVPPTLHVCGSRRFAEVLVPEDHLFVMGDNRAVSQDSRCQGTVPIENVIGRAFLIVWPGSRWETLNVPDTFDAVPEPVAVGRLAPVRADPVAALLALPVLASLVGWSRPRLARRSRARRLRR